MHAVEFVGEQELPLDHDFLFIRDDGDGGVFYLRRSAISPSMLEDAWAAYRALVTGDRPPPADQSGCPWCNGHRRDRRHLYRVSSAVHSQPHRADAG